MDAKVADVSVRLRKSNRKNSVVARRPGNMLLLVIVSEPVRVFDAAFVACSILDVCQQRVRRRQITEEVLKLEGDEGRRGNQGTISEGAVGFQVPDKVGSDDFDIVAENADADIGGSIQGKDAIKAVLGSGERQDRNVFGVRQQV